MTTAYLTVDDAPSEDLPEKLDVLDDRGVTALFFCEGRRLDDYADHARQALEAGHLLGNHAYSHTHGSELSVEEFRGEVEETEALLEGVHESAGVERFAKLFRFPYGDAGGDNHDAFQAVLADHGFAPPKSTGIDETAAEVGGDRDWGWTVDVEDWTADSPAELRERVADVSVRFETGSEDVILFHDDGNTAEQFAAFVDELLDRGVDLGDPREAVR